MTDLHEVYVDQYRDRPQHDLDATKAQRAVNGFRFRVSRAQYGHVVVPLEEARAVAEALGHGRVSPEWVQAIQEKLAWYEAAYTDEYNRRVERDRRCSVGTSGEVPAHAAPSLPTSD